MSAWPDSRSRPPHVIAPQEPHGRSDVPTRSLDLPIRRARVELTPATRGLAAVDGWLYVAVAAVCAFGLVMVYSASEVLAYQQTGNPSYYFERQIAYMVVGLTGMLVLARLDYHHLLRFSRAIGLITVLMLLAVLVPPHRNPDQWSPALVQPRIIELQPSRWRRSRRSSCSAGG